MNLRKLFSLFLALLLIAAPIASIGVAADDDAIIAFNEPAIPATVGEKIDLTSYAVEFAEGSPEKATFKNGETEITEFTPASAGVTALTAVSGDKSKNIYVVAKNKDDAEYVLYYNGFDDDNALSELQPIGGSSLTLSSVKDGKLVINALGNGGYRLLLPAWLGDFGNYRIEMSSAVAQATDTARWQSIMYRIQKNDYPYYHMCIRQNAASSNGVEFAVRTPSNQWDVQTTGSYVESQKANTFYTHSVEIKGNFIKQSINGNMCVWSSSEKAYKAGRIGIQVNYSNINIDYIKVSLQLDKPSRPKADSATLTSAEVRNINNSLGVSSELTFADTLNDLKDAHNVILTVKGNDVIDKDGKAIFALDELYDKVGTSIVPIFRVNSTADADTALAFIAKDKKNNDFSFISTNPDVVKYVRQKNTRVRGILDLTEKYTSLLTSENISELRLAVNSSLAKTALIDISCLDKETVLKIQMLNVNVWVADKSFSSIVDSVKMLTSGANGIVVNSPSKLAEAYDLFASNSLTRTPIIIGHRGNPTNAPENSISSYLIAWQNGSDVLETDIYLTADNEIVIMHDGDINRTTTGSGNIESMTVEQLKQFNLWGDNDVYKSKFPDEKIPTLRDMFEAIKDNDAKVFVEIKSGKAAICQKLADLIDEYNFSDRVCVISFNATQLANLQKIAPQITCGYLLGAPSASTTPEEAGEEVYKVINAIQPYNSSFNPSYSNQSEEFIDACTERGIAVWPWTYASGSKEAFSNAFRWGYNGLTTNDCQLTAKTVRIINASVDAIELNRGESTSIEINARTYDRTVTDVASKAEMIVIEGDNVTFENGTLTADSDAVVMFRYECRLIDGTRYSLYTSPVMISVKSAVESSKADTGEESNTISSVISDNAGSSSEPSEEKSNTVLWIIIAAIAVIAVAAVVIVFSKKKK